MKIEDGKCYRTRDGRKKGPVKIVKDENTGLKYALSGKETWSTSGVWWEGRKTENDLVAEWVDEPSIEIFEPFMSPVNEMTGPFYSAPHPTGATEGRKDDDGKDRFELLPPEFLSGVARVLTFGAKKYEDRNWEKGMSWGRVFGAANRHLWAWWGGAGPTTKSFLFGDLDSETGYSHLWHAACCLAFLVTYEERRIGTDDRSKKPSTSA